MSDKRCCPTDKGVPHCPYTPSGDGYYMAGPIDSKRGVLIIGDIFGIHVDNSKRYVDHLAEEGYLVLCPDFFPKGAWAKNNWPPDFESEEWKAFYAYMTDFETHGARARRGVALMRKMGVEKVCVGGFCWGTTVAVNLGKEGVVDAVATAHPSFLTPELLDGYQGPLCILPSKDEGSMENIKAKMDQLPGSPHVFKCYDKLDHGFLAARFDYNHFTEEEMVQLKDAMKVLSDFLNEALK